MGRDRTVGPELGGIYGLVGFAIRGWEGLWGLIGVWDRS